MSRPGASLFASVLLLTACSAGAPSGSSPTGAASTATPAGGSSAAPSAAPSVAETAAPVPTGPLSSFEIPSFAVPSFPSFEPDLELEALFPAEIDGQPVTGVESVNFLAFLQAIEDDQAQIDAFVNG
jgi:hypothetical protein